MKRILFLGIIIIAFGSCDFSKYQLQDDYDFTTRFEISNGTETDTYPNVISFYEDLAKAYPSVQLKAFDTTDSGEPLHLAIFNPDAQFDIAKIKENKSILLVLNGIHPGESDGIDATMMMFRDMAQDSIKVPENVVLATIPVYNIGGALNRNSFSRTNQNGPKAYGFRGNARNYDLNRDFAKADSKNARAFYKIYHYLDPEVFIDNHVSNGADYQYVLTHLFTQHNRLGGDIGKYLDEKMMPALEDSLKIKNLDITPYVNVFNEVPENGFSQFVDYPRYSTGYTTMWNTLGMMVETHMLKPYDKRVWGTYELMRSMVAITDNQSEKIKGLRAAENKKYLTKRWYPVHYKPDMEDPSIREFKAYEGKMIPSEVTGGERLKYDRSKAFTKDIEYFNNFVAEDRIDIPRAYVIPQGWWNVIDLLKLNNIKMKAFEKDTTMYVQQYKIENYQTGNSPYEGHYMHRNTEVSASMDSIKFRKGDYYVSTFQDGVRYLLEMLEPAAEDSFFNWNYFDTVLQQKEHFSPYVFEDIAKDLLDKNPDLKDTFEDKKTNDPDFAQNWYAQLEWIHKHSKYYETAHLRYPIFRIPR
ncbi:M14 family metallopeptidase [Zunongwangia atlantica]|uniref:M14 family peptidase n=1 Tax=Zunongwangia atlantica 22II14-10F7 TaxID=1185767 RepID=A0A1Y1T497_9FLAO|nr:M14 family metallopeptidase [Zunongwangia atlantica]ORL45870.1 M14 family peptidase [Zunongwangia atlantica 22II14-10F7]